MKTTEGARAERTIDSRLVSCAQEVLSAAEEIRFIRTGRADTKTCKAQFEDLREAAYGAGDVRGALKRVAEIFSKEVELLNK